MLLREETSSSKLTMEEEEDQAVVATLIHPPTRNFKQALAPSSTSNKVCDNRMLKESLLNNHRHKSTFTKLFLTSLSLSSSTFKEDLIRHLPIHHQLTLMPLSLVSNL
jgi:hypothetical protein